MPIILGVYYAICVISIAVSAAVVATACVIGCIKMPSVELRDKLPVSGVLRRISMYDGRSSKIDLRRYCICSIRLCDRLVARVYKLESSKIRSFDLFIASVMRVKRKLYTAYSELKWKKCARIFEVCKDVVSCTHGEISERLLGEIEQMLRERGICGDECAHIRTVTSVCLCAFVIRCVELEAENAEKYLRGLSDGKAGAIDLNGLNDNAYVSGLYRDCGENAEGFDRLLEINGVSKQVSFFEYKKVRAVRYCGIYNALLSLGIASQDPKCDGGEIFCAEKYKTNVLRGNAEVFTDSHGKCAVRGKTFDVELDTGEGQRLDLRACDGVFQAHRTVYRTVADVELCVEIVPSFEFDGALAKITVINGAIEKSVRLTVIADIISDENFCALDGRSVRYIELKPFMKYACIAAIGADGISGDALRYERCYANAELCSRIFSAVDESARAAPENYDGIFVYAPSRAIKGKYANVEPHDGIYATARDVFVPRALPLIAIEANGKLYTPFDGNFCVNIALGYEEYISDCGDIVFTLRRYKSGRAEIFDLSHNGNISAHVLFAADCGADGTAIKSGNALYTQSVDGRLAVYCSLNIDEYTAYFEGYSSHGVVDRAASLRSDGINFAPALVCECSSANGRAVFCVEKFDAEPTVGMFDVSVADKAFLRLKSLSTRAIKPRTSDRRLNFCFERALLTAVENSTDVLLKSLIFKYSDRTAMREAVFDLCSRQYPSGETVDCCAAVLPIIADEYSRSASDILEEKVEFIGGDSATVEEHCLRAIEYCANAYDVCAQAVLYNALVRFAGRVRHARKSRFIYILSKIKTDVEGYLRESFDDDRIRTLIFISACIGSDRFLSKTLAEIEAYIGDGKNAVKRLGGELAVLYANMLYSASKPSEAYKVIKAVTEYLIEETDGAPRIISQSEATADIASLYYLTVTERLFGIKLKGDKAAVSPEIAPNTPHLEFELGLDGKRLHVIVDDGCADGEWSVRMGRLVCGSNTVGKNMHSPVTVFKNSCKLSERVI